MTSPREHIRSGLFVICHLSLVICHYLRLRFVISRKLPTLLGPCRIIPNPPSCDGRSRKCSLVSWRGTMLLRRGITHREVRRILGSTLNLLTALLCFALLNPSVFAHKRSSALKAQAASIPAGTQIEVSMLDELNTGKTAAGDTFQASLAKALVVNGRTVAPRGSALSGTVTNVVSAGRLKRPASITLAIT